MPLLQIGNTVPFSSLNDDQMKNLLWKSIKNIIFVHLSIFVFYQLSQSKTLSVGTHDFLCESVKENITIFN